MSLKDTNEVPLARSADELVGLIRRRAENLFETHQLLCSEAVLHTLNQGLGGGLPPEAAIRIASPFSEGIGGAGCACGGFSGALMAVGLFLGRQGLGARGLKTVQVKGRELHDLFRSEFGSTCCKVLTKKVRHDQKALMKLCTLHTGKAAEAAARLILEARPELVAQADLEFLCARDTKLSAGFNRILSVLRP
ncbi:MAG: C_GCAxxG_C_C family protein [Deltaproteobacteria bacterium]|nr:C_GCAxxG_C_C family protein [Deltaproteobacteria bacterium]